MWLRKWAQAALGSAGVTAVGLLALEGLARLTTGGAGMLHGGARTLWQYDARLGWALRPSAVGSGRIENVTRPGPDAAVVHVNSLGLRGPELGADGRRRVLVLGDSFAMGVGVDDEHTVAALLGRHLGPTWEVVNGGVSGYSTDQEYLFYERFAPLLPGVGIVVLVTCDNDFHQNVEDAAFDYRKPFFVLREGRLELRNVPVPGLTGVEEGKRWLARHSYGWGWLRTRTGATAGAQALLDRLRVAVPRETGEDPLKMTVELVAALNERVQARGARLLVTHTARKGENRLAVGRLLYRLQRRGVACLRVDTPFTAAREAAADDAWDFGNDSHWNVRGHELMAELLFRDVQARGWIAVNPAGGSHSR